MALCRSRLLPHSKLFLHVFNADADVGLSLI